MNVKAQQTRLINRYRRLSPPLEIHAASKIDSVAPPARQAWFDFAIECDQLVKSITRLIAKNNLLDRKPLLMKILRQTEKWRLLGEESGQLWDEVIEISRNSDYKFWDWVAVLLGKNPPKDKWMQREYRTLQKSWHACGKRFDKLARERELLLIEIEASPSRAADQLHHSAQSDAGP